MTKLTKRTVETMSGDAKDRIVFDTELPGFGLRISPMGRECFVYPASDHETLLEAVQATVVERGSQERTSSDYVASGSDSYFTFQPDISL